METFNAVHPLAKLLGLPPIAVVFVESTDGQPLRTREAEASGVGEAVAGRIDLRWKGDRWLRTRGVLAELLPSPWSLAGALLDTSGGAATTAHPDALASLLLEIARADEALSAALGDGDRRFALQGIGEHADRRTFVARRLPAVFETGQRRPWFVRPDAVDGLAASVELRAGMVGGFEGGRKFHWRVASSPETRAAGASRASEAQDPASPPIV